MKMKVIAGFAFLVNTVLFATYYAVAKEALGRIDPIVFTFFEMTTLAPVALAILAFTYQKLTWTLIKRGVLLGSCLCLALFTIAIALKYSTATGTAFFPALNGFLAALIAWLVLRQPMNKATWLAGLLSVAGTALLIANSEMGGMRGTAIAFLGGLFFTLYVFLSDNGPKEAEHHKPVVHWPLLAVELLTMALWASLVVLLFGDWQAFHPSFPKDGLIILYVAGACTFLPTLIAILMQRHISAVSISFIYILEPVVGVVVAHFYLHEVLPLAGYLGGALVVVGAFVHTWGSVARPTQETLQEQYIQTSQSFAAEVYSSYLSPILYCCSGFLVLYGLGGFPPQAWRELAPLVPILLNWLHPEHRAMSSMILNTLLQGPQRQSFLLLLVQGLCWLIGWGVCTGITCIMFFHILTRGKAKRSGKGDIHTGSRAYGNKGARKGNAPPIQREMLGSGASMGGAFPLRAPLYDDFRHKLTHKGASPVIPSSEPMQELYGSYALGLATAYTENSIPSNAVWGGPLDCSTEEQASELESPLQVSWFHFMPEDTSFDAESDIQNVTTDELSPVMPVLSMPMSQSSKDYFQNTTRVKLAEYVE